MNRGSLPTINVGQRLAGALASGHPWLYRDALPPNSLRTGEWVRVVAGESQAFGVFDEEGAIGVRLFSRQQLPDDGWLRERVREAVSLRAPLAATATDAYRLLYGEGDGLPGIVVDRYGRHGIVKLYAPGVGQVLERVVRHLARELPWRGISLRDETGLRPLYGDLPPPELTVREHGLQMISNPYEGQKTGLFLDQRDNRQYVRSVAGDRDVLNLFAYNGGFSLAALAGGARRVTSVDIAPQALEDARRNVELNGFAAGQHQTVQADVFDFLEKSGDQYGLVVCDPPSFARAKRSRRAAERAYVRLNALAMRRVRPGGLLATASCTSQVTPEAFREALAQAAQRAGVRAQVVHEAGHPVDHPVPLHFPEGRYLKFLLLRITGSY